MAMRKAQRRKAKLRLGLSGPAGSGKTMGALLVAYGITGDWEKICLIDTENGSGDLYANYSQEGVEIGEYNIIPIAAPYAPDKYNTAIKECEAAGMECIIIDSLSHAWSGEGGLLDKKGQIEKKTGNGWTAWRDISPMHNRLVESILSSQCHVIATLRAKMEHVQEKNDKGKTIIRKVGMSPIQRDGMEYEFTTFIDIDQDHQCTSSKDRTSIVDGKMFALNVDMGRKFKEWLDTGIEVPMAQKSTGKTVVMDAEKARRTFFAAVSEVATKTGVDKDFANQTAKELVYAWLNIDSMTKLGPEQWISLIQTAKLEDIKKELVAAIDKKLLPEEDENINIQEETAAQTQGA